jgi:rhamnosyltransferase
VCRPEADGWVRRDYAAALPSEGPAPDFMAWSLPFAAVKREVWEKHPFYEDAWASEDTEWGVWAKRTGHVVQYVADAIVMHSHNYTLAQAYGRRFVEGEADAFIQDAPFGVAQAARAYAASVAGDVRVLGSNGDLRGAVESVVRRGVYHWAYLKGRRHGATRRRAGSADRAAGQEVVLARYG